MRLKDSNLSSEGDFHPAGYIRLLHGLFSERKTGTLRLIGPRKNYELLVVAGHIVALIGGSRQTLSRSLVDMGVVNETELIRAQAWAGEGGSIENALVELGVLSQEEMDDSAELLLSSEIGKPLSWTTGKWTFAEKSSFDHAHIDPALLKPAFNLQMLWHVVSRDLPIAVIENDLNLPINLLMDAQLLAALDELAMPSTFGSLPEVLSVDNLVSEVVRQLGAGDEIKRGVWLLLTLELLRDQNQAPQASLFTGNKQENEITPPTKKTKAVQDAEANERGQKLIRVIRSDYRRRMGQNYYAFLGLETDASREEIDREARRLNKRWRAIRGSISLDSAMEQKVDELIDSVGSVHKTLGSQKSKKAYDKHMSKGRAPVVGVAAENVDSVKEIESLMDANAFERAIPKLQQLRRDGVLSAEVMSSLGWCKWKIGLKKEGEDEVALALSLDPRHPKALEYSARIAIEQNKKRRAKKRILLLLQHQPDHVWANRVLADLPKDESDMISGDVRWYRDEDNR